MKLRTILATAISTSIVVAALVVSPSSANPVSDLVTANYEGSQWALKAIRAQDAWDAGTTGSNVKVAVIDTGVDPTHPDLSGQIIDGATITYDSENTTNDGITIADTVVNDFTDDEGHGTHVAGIIAARHNSSGITGLAYGAKIMPIKLANLGDMDLAAFSTALVDALQFAVDNGAQVANLSLGGPALEESPYVDLTPDDDAYKAYTTAICNAVTAAKNAGVVVVAAAGNYYQQGNPALVPSSCTDAVSVASQAPNSTSTSYFSTTDPGVDITAPGENIISTYPTTAYDGLAYQDFPYLEMSGTSMASPYVAAAAALYIQHAGDPSVAETISHLESSATDMTAIVGWDPYTGSGLLDAAALVGADSQQTSVSVQPYLRVTGGRPGNNYSDSLTFLWDAPQESALPTGYDLVISEKTSGTVHTYAFDGNQVRGTIPWLTIDDYSYIQLIAHYAGHDEESFPQLYSVPQSSASPLPTPTGLRYTLDPDGELHVNWNSVPGAGVKFLELTVSGTSVDWIQQDFYKGNGGNFATSFNTYLSGVDVMNSDISISLQAWSSDFNAGDVAEVTRHASAPMAVTEFEFLSNKVLRVSGIANRAGCDPDAEGNCLAKLFTYTTTVTTLAPGGRIKTTKGKSGLNGYSDDFGQIYFDNLLTNVAQRDTLQYVTLVAKSNVRNNPYAPVYIYFELPMGSTPASIRQQAGIPAKKG